MVDREEVFAIMKTRLLALVLATLMLMLSAVPAMGVTGREYGVHVKAHALEQHFSGEENPGNHQGFAGFEEHHEH
jgi:hypothetical protein